MTHFPLSGVLLFEVGCYYSLTSCSASHMGLAWPGPGPGKFENLSEILSKSERQFDNFPKSENQNSEDQKSEGEKSEN